MFHTPDKKNITDAITLGGLAQKIRHSDTHLNVRFLIL